MAGQIQTLQEMINQVVKGKQKVVEKVLCAMLAGGHILLEDIPGVGKTTLAMAIAKATDLTYRLDSNFLLAFPHRNSLSQFVKQGKIRTHTFFILSYNKDKISV